MSLFVQFFIFFMSEVQLKREYKMDSSTENLATQRFYITDKEIRKVLGVSQPTLWRWTKELGFPKAMEGMRGKRPYKEFIEWAQERGMV